MDTKLICRNLTNTTTSSLVMQHDKNDHPTQQSLNFPFINFLTSWFLSLTSCLLTLVNLPANAAQFQVSGKFSPQTSLNKNRPTAWLENGSFQGTFDVSDIPENKDIFKVNEWEFNLYNAGGSKIFSFNSQQKYNYQLEGKRGSSGSTISFIFNLFEEPQPSINYRRFAYFELYLDTPDLVGNINSSSRFSDLDTVINYNNFSVQQKQYEIKILSGASEPLLVQPVSENMSIAGLVSVGVLGIFRQYRPKFIGRFR